MKTFQKIPAAIEIGTVQIRSRQLRPIQIETQYNTEQSHTEPANLNTDRDPVEFDTVGTRWNVTNNYEASYNTAGLVWGSKVSEITYKTLTGF